MSNDYEEELENQLFRLGSMLNPPCFLCGYNGPEYFNPETHPCAERHHKFFDENARAVGPQPPSTKREVLGVITASCQHKLNGSTRKHRSPLMNRCAGATVGSLKKILEDIPDDYIFVTNDVGNITLLRPNPAKEHYDYSYAEAYDAIGWIELVGIDVANVGKHEAHLELL